MSEITPIKILVAGSFGAGTTTFTHAISDPEVLPADDAIVAMDFGRVNLDETHILYLFGMPHSYRFDFAWEITEDGLLGTIVLVDSCNLSLFRDTRNILCILAKDSPTPYIIAANKQDLAGAMSPEDVRIVYHIDRDVLIVPCVATDRESVKQVLINLCELVLSQSE